MSSKYVLFPFLESPTSQGAVYFRYLLQAEIMKRLRILNEVVDPSHLPATSSSSGSGSSGISGSTSSIHIPLPCKPADGSLSIEEEKQLLEDSLIVSINGIAQGMKNSG